MNSPTVSVIGLGPMGHPIAKNLVATQRRVAVWNRTASRADDLVELGAVRAQTLVEAAAPVVLSVLPDVDHLCNLLTAEARAAWAKAGTHLVVLSTTGPGKIRALARELAEDGIAVIDAPVSGGVAGARDASLSVMVGGEDQHVEAVRDVLEDIGATVLHLGPSGSGAMAKLCNQIVVAGTLASLGEACALARKSGLDLDALFVVLGGGLASSEVLHQKQEKLRSRSYSLGGSTDNQVKDLDYAAEAATDVGLGACMVPVLLELYGAAVALGRGQEDHSVVQEVFLDS